MHMHRILGLSYTGKDPLKEIYQQPRIFISKELLYEMSSLIFSIALSHSRILNNSVLSYVPRLYLVTEIFMLFSFFPFFKITFSAASTNDSVVETCLNRSLLSAIRPLLKMPHNAKRYIKLINYICSMNTLPQVLLSPVLNFCEYPDSSGSWNWKSVCRIWTRYFSWFISSNRANIPQKFI